MQGLQGRPPPAACAPPAHLSSSSSSPCPCLNWSQSSELLARVESASGLSRFATRAARPTAAAAAAAPAPGGGGAAAAAAAAPFAGGGPAAAVGAGAAPAPLPARRARAARSCARPCSRCAASVPAVTSFVTWGGGEGEDRRAAALPPFHPTLPPSLPSPNTSTHTAVAATPTCMVWPANLTVCVMASFFPAAAARADATASTRRASTGGRDAAPLSSLAGGACPAPRGSRAALNDARLGSAKKGGRMPWDRAPLPAAGFAA